MRGYGSGDVDPPPMVSLCLSASCEGDYNVSGAGGVGDWCNGIYYRNNDTYDGKPSFSQIGGECMIYHLQQWKITFQLQTGSWYYMAEGDPKPPQGRWLNIPCVTCAGGSPAVRACENRAACDYVVSGATGALEATQCNGNYRQDGRLNGKPLYKQTSGKKECFILYFITWEIGFIDFLPTAGWYVPSRGHTSAGPMGAGALGCCWACDRCGAGVPMSVLAFHGGSAFSGSGDCSSRAMRDQFDLFEKCSESSTSEG